MIKLKYKEAVDFFWELYQDGHIDYSGFPVRSALDKLDELLDEYEKLAAIKDKTSLERIKAGYGLNPLKENKNE